MTNIDLNKHLGKAKYGNRYTTKTHRTVARLVQANLMTEDEVVKQLGCCKSSVKNWVRDYNNGYHDDDSRFVGFTRTKAVVSRLSY